MTESFASSLLRPLHPPVAVLPLLRLRHLRIALPLNRHPLPQERSATHRAAPQRTRKKSLSGYVPLSTRPRPFPCPVLLPASAHPHAPR
ncbi:hypothetical protein BD311DRAFT_748654 [Dichomitus squalens]|uniref:Uncharacterized protein n=1 Tax=Dichomitus squalens TaxID=114155 RepID=A0A4Q9N3W5_9APHY|nr:hypothetical protein BD311DRAFT_748654 [Dichomitus squalens]